MALERIGLLQMYLDRKAMGIASACKHSIGRLIRLMKEIVELSRLVGVIATARFCVLHAGALALCKTGRRRQFGSVSLRVHGVSHPLTLRPATSDYGVFRKIFVEREYAPLDDLDAPRLIIDCGANVGYSSAYFLSRFPTARVIAVEPDPDNADVCRRNLVCYGDRAQVLVRAVWPRSTRLTLLHYGDLGDRGECGIQVYETTSVDSDPAAGGDWPEHVHRGPNPPVPFGEVEAVSIPAIIDSAGDIPVDLLKMDIEKAELEVFRAAELEWLAKVKNIAIELHGAAERNAFTAALEPYRCESMESGELTICRNITPAASPTQ
jgi:FkbM family methyltransferase